MSTAASWSVKGIDPKARDLARDLARRSGLTLGEWLNQMITDTGDEPPAEGEVPPAAAPARWPAAANRAAGAPSGASVIGAEGLRSRLREAGLGSEAGEAAKVTRALGELTARLEAAEHRSTLAISGIDQQAMGVLARLDSVERSAADVTGRAAETLEEVREMQAQIAERLVRLEAGDEPRAAALRGLESALGRVAVQIQEGEARTRAHTVETRDDVSSLSRRIDRVESRAEVGPVEAALERLAERVDRLDSVPPVDTSALDAAYARLAGRLDDDGRRTGASMRALETAFTDLGARLDQVGARVDQAGARIDHVEAGGFDAALARLAARLDEAQARTGAAVRALEASFAGLDQRLARSEHAAAAPKAPSAAMEDAGRLERLAAELHEKVDGARAEMATRLRDAADGKLDRMEAAVRELSEQVAHTEQRSAEAIDRMGREVVRIAQGLDGRMGEVDRRSDARATQMGGEMARIADAVEQRLTGADGAQAQALEKLGGEIARIAEKLADRIAASERRNAQDLTHGLDEVSEQLQRATDKLNNRYESAGADLAERIRASEERTHRLLAEAHERTEAATPARRAPGPAPAPASDADRADSELGVAAARDTAEEPRAFVPGPFAPDEELADLDPFGGFDAEPAHRSDPLREERAEAFASDAFVSDPFASEPLERDPFVAAMGRPSATTPAAAEALHAPEPSPAPVRPGSTRELIEQARAAARASAERSKRPVRGARGAPPEELFSAPAPGFEAAEPALRSRFALPKLRRREASTAKTALYATGVAVPLSVAAVGAMLMAGEGRGHAPTAIEAPSAAPPLAAAAPVSAPMLAVAQTAPTPVIAAPPAPDAIRTASEEAPVSAAAAYSGRALYNEAVRELERGDRGAVEVLKRAANLGYAPAQFHLGKLYEDGSNGVGKDLGQARRWTERAARGGDGKAMFNYGLFLANGEGVARDDRAAVDWFRRAADAGVKDAQFNLAVMTQQGRGAPANTADAYKWYLIAAADGDQGARAGAEALKPQLSADAQAAAERSATAYRAQLAATAAAAQVRTASN